MAADRQLARDIAGYGGNQPDIGGAFAAGSKLITDQIQKNIETDRADEDRKYELERRQDEEFLRKQSLEQQQVAYNAKKAAYFDQITQAREKGLISTEAYTEAIANREEFWKDQTKALKLGVDSVSLSRRLKSAAGAEANWGKALDFSSNVAISDSNPEAQKIDNAITGWGKENGATPPPIVSIEGKDYFEIPSPDGEEPVRIAVDTMNSLERDSQLFGQYAKPVDMKLFQADFLAQRPEIINRLAKGEGSGADLAEIGKWFDTKIESPIQVRELAEDLFMQTGFDATKYNIQDVDGDGKITAADLDVNKDGEIDASEGRIVKEVFQDIIKAKYPGNDFSGRTQAQKQVTQTIDYVAQGGNPTALVGLPGVFDVTIKDGVAYAHMGKDRSEKNAFAIPLNADGTVSADGIAKLKLKLGYTSAPKVNVSGSDPKPDDITDDTTDDTPQPTDVDSGDQDNPPTDTAEPQRTEVQEQTHQFAQQGAVIEGGQLVEKGTLSSSQVRDIETALNISPEEITQIQKLVKDRRIAVDPDTGEIVKTGSASSREVKKIKRLLLRIELNPDEGLSIFPKGYKRTVKRA